MIPYGKHSIDDDDIKSVLDILSSDWITQGPQVPLFEKALSEYVGSDFCLCLNSATSALHAAYSCLGLKSGLVLWTTPISFVATANAALFCGANIDFVDIDENTFCLCPNALEEKLKYAKLNNFPLPHIVTVVHFAGHPCDMVSIYKLSKEYDFFVVEDASHAFGSKYADDYIGSCKFSDVCIFSFHPVKIITTGEGGCITTNNHELAFKVSLFRSHGINKNKELFFETNYPDFYYEMQSLGYNYRMNDLSAALGLSQLNKIDNFIQSRYTIAKNYNILLNDLDIIFPIFDDNNLSSWHLYVIQIKNNAISRDEVFSYLRKNDIGVQIHYIPIHCHPFYKNLGFNNGMYPKSENYFNNCLSLPIYYNLNYQDQLFVCNTLQSILL